MIDNGDDDSHANSIHLLRTVQAHHVALSGMADQKANILIGVNSVIFALVLREAAAMTMPMMVMAACSALAAALCVIAVVPAVGASRLTRGEPNILFFGTFTRMSEAEFLHAIDTVLSSDANIRHAMARDVYQLGMVLKRKKFRFLSWGYRVFIFGIIATVTMVAAGHIPR